MNRKRMTRFAFVLLIMAQLYVPGKMIWDNERIWLQGTAHHFKTAPVDPLDIFRGKYIDLFFEANMVEVANKSDWIEGEEVFGILTTDTEGYSSISTILKHRPEKGVEYLKVTIQYIPDYEQNTVQIRFPFDRFYMEESKAHHAELSYIAATRDTTSTTYALVSILEGASVIKDVLIDDVPISEVAESMRENTDP